MMDDLKSPMGSYDNVELISFQRNAHSAFKHTFHVFCDASRKAFGVAAYAVSNPGHAHFLTAKSRATLKNLSGQDEENLTLHKLELTV